MRVLIVDDSRTARLILKKELPAACRGDITEASGGREAIDKCTSQSFDVMFLDLTMPELDGFQVLEHLSAAQRLPRTIVVSADSQPGARDRVLALGALAFLKKTPSREQIEGVLAALV